ncbi:MAG: hypothetical protein ACAF41_16500 [Leptolyngbya sp. BL-A-14]
MEAMRSLFLNSLEAVTQSITRNSRRIIRVRLLPVTYFTRSAIALTVGM